MVKDNIVIYRKNEIILILISLKRDFSHHEKSKLKSSLTLRRYCNSGPGLVLDRDNAYIFVYKCLPLFGAANAEQFSLILASIKSILSLQKLVKLKCFPCAKSYFPLQFALNGNFFFISCTFQESPPYLLCFKSVQTLLKL